MATSNGDAYKRGRSGYSVKDEKDSKAAGALDYKMTKDSGLPGYDRKHRRDIGAPHEYLSNVKTAKGRQSNKDIEKFTKDDISKNRAKRLANKPI